MTPTRPELTCQASNFQLPPGTHYLNCAYMAPLLRRSEQAGVEAIRRKRCPAEIIPDDFFSLPGRTRELFARLIGSPEPARVAILPSASYGIAAAARNLPLGKGRNIVVAASQFPSNMLIWRRLSRETGARLHVVESPSTPRGRILNEGLLEAIGPDTAVVAIGTVHWTDGTRFELEAIAARARDVGAALILDGTQSVGVLPFDVDEIRPDALICAAYKWLLGPYSTALGWFGPRFDDGRPLEETWCARVGSEDFRDQVNYRDQYRPQAERFDVGERSNFILLPMLNEALEQLLEWGVGRIAAYCAWLSTPLMDASGDLGFRVEEPRWRSPHLFGLVSAVERDIEALGESLKRRGIHVSCRGSAVRVAPHVYNREADLEALEYALAELV